MRASNANRAATREPISRAATEAAPSAAFTPGPWRVIDPDKNGQPVVAAQDYEVATCWHHCVGSIEREARANAALISAAPELMAVVKRAIEMGVYSHSPDSNLMPAMLAAISKAEGRDND
jgi:hypothetical protein